jgi:hypothetical protein
MEVLTDFESADEGSSVQKAWSVCIPMDVPISHTSQQSAWEEHGSHM